MRNKSASFDFDGTLTLPSVQDYAKDLISRGFDVWIVTSRYDDLHKHLYPKNPTNEDLYKIASKVGIEKHKIKFMNMMPKADYFYNTRILFHLDDDMFDILNINDISVKAIYVKSENWLERCEKILSSEV